MKNFIKVVLPHMKDFYRIRVLTSDIEEMKTIVLKTLELKDEFQLNDRLEGVAFLTNFLDKALPIKALEKLFNSTLLNWTKVSARNFNPELMLGDISLDVYSCQYGTLPKIPIFNKRGAIITMRKNSQDVLICGYATKEVLNSFQDKSFLTGIVSNNDKTIFTGFNSLYNFETLEELSFYLDKLKIKN